MHALPAGTLGTAYYFHGLLFVYDVIIINITPVYSIFIGFSVPFLFSFPNLVIPKLQDSVKINMGHASVQRCKQQIIIQR